MAEDGSFNADAPELVMLDQNEMAKGLKFLGLGAAQVSDDGNLLAYSTDTTGFRQYTLHVKALVTRRAYADTAERVTSVEWANDNQTLFYVTEDKVTKRPNQLWRLDARVGARADLRGEGRAVRHRRRPDEGQTLSGARRQQHRHVGEPLPGRRHAERAVQGRAAAREGPQVLGRSPRRPLLHSDQQGREELPHGDRPGRRSGAGQLEGVHPAPPGCADPGPRAVQGLRRVR